MKKEIRLNESELHSLIEGTVKAILKEGWDDSKDTSISDLSSALNECGWTYSDFRNGSFHGRPCSILRIYNDAGTHSARDLMAFLKRRCRRIDYEFGDEEGNIVLYVF